MISIKKKIDFNIKIISIWIISFFPISVILGSLVAEISIFILNFLFLLKFKNKNLIKDKNLILFLIIWFYLILNIIASNNENNEFLRQISYIRFIIFAFAIKEFVTNKEDLNFIFKIWLIVFLITFIDLIYEKINGYNLLGFKSPNKLRLVGFLKDELRIAYIISGFCFLIFGYLLNYKKNYFLPIIFLLLTIAIIFITGERSNFLKSIIFLFLFTFFAFNKNLKIFFFINLMVITMIISLFSFVKSSNSLYNQLYERIFIKDENNKINIYKNYKKFAPHAGHFGSAFKIANDYPIFGVGIKNFRITCTDEKYITEEFSLAEVCSTHPHQIYLEIIAETGYLGLLFIILPFLLFIIRNIQSFYNSQNYIQLAGTILLIIHFIPILPSGSFFTNFTGFIFWLNVGFILSSYNFKNFSLK